MNQEDRDRLETVLADADRALTEAYEILYANRETDTGWALTAEAGSIVAQVVSIHGFSVKV